MFLIAMNKLLITIPCYNEELILKKNIEVLLDYAQKNLSDYKYVFLIIDNASDDDTYKIAGQLAVAHSNLLISQCFEKGRGAALRKGWLKYQGYDVYAYMDIDLATDLNQFKDLISKVELGNHVSIGSRYISGAKIKRSPKREFLSRIYNLLLKMFFNVKFKDAQCGFKAFRGDALQLLLPKTKDNGWFWDTEILILAERAGYRIYELPVSWLEVRDEIRKSKVSPFVEVVRQLKNIIQLRKRL